MVCEPQCLASEHAAVNAALLQTVTLAFPDSRIRFFAEPGHLEWVHGILRQKAPAIAGRVTWTELSIPDRSATGWNRYAQELGWTKRILNLARRGKAAAILLSSITGPGLLALKLKLYATGAATPILAVPHAVLGTLLEPQPLRPWRWLISLRQVLRLPHPRNLAYLALGESIEATLQERFPGISGHFRSLDLPLMPGPTTVVAPPSQGGTIRFGFLGSAAHPAKGFATFLRLASEITSRSPGAEFALVGTVPTSLKSSELTRPLSAFWTDPLSDSAYSQMAGRLHFVVGTGIAQHYRLRASATFLDALSHVKPGIYLRTPYVEHYFKKLGDIGYLCDTYDGMRDLILGMIQEFPLTRYQTQCENILVGRQVFDPAVLAPQLRRLLSYD